MKQIFMQDTDPVIQSLIVGGGGGGGKNGLGEDNSIHSQ